MRILFTGASSFTGHWFVRELAQDGHEVVTVLRRPLDAYDGVRRVRVEVLRRFAECRHGPSFGDAAFLELAEALGPFDLLCHHAADVTNYRSPDFDVLGAVANNTRNLDAVLRVLAARGCGGMVLTGSLFEAGEGAGTEPLRAFSPYGLSKTLTATIVADACARIGMPLAKFVIPNPFGPFEEARFTSYLVAEWRAGRVPAVRTPRYVRDNIHVTLLAKDYARFVAAVARRGAGTATRRPSGLVASQGDFALRFASEMAGRLGIDCPVEIAEQKEFSEPAVRINTEPPDTAALGWNEAAAWDGLATWYLGNRA
jgi:UDP-glucose 4-epimerase